jgi:hypothetical protein
MKILLLLLMTTPAFAFSLITNIGAAFTDSEVKVYVASNTNCTNNNLTISDLLEYSKEAIKLWNRVPSAKLKLAVKGTYDTSDALYATGILCPDDGTNPCNPSTSVPRAKNIIITCNSETTNNFKSSSYLALTTPVYLSGGNIKGSAILLNDSVNTTLNTLSGEQITSIIAHEIGHAIGIGHSKDTSALMYYKNSGRRVRLNQDDIDAVSYLYPKVVFEGCDGFIGSINDKKTPPNFPGLFLFTLSVCFFVYRVFKLRKI